MILSAICIVNGPGKIGLAEHEGVLYIYTENQIDQVPAQGKIYTIEEGYNKFYLGEAEVVEELIRKLGFPDRENHLIEL